MSGYFSSLPPAWRCEKLKHVADFWVSNVDKLTIENEIPVRLCNYTDVYHREFITPDLPLMEATATKAEIAKFCLKAGDVVITKDSESWDDIAVPALIERSAPDMVCGYHLSMIRGRDAQLDGRYLFRCFQSGKIRSQLEVEAKGVTRYGLPNSAIGEALLPIPPLPTQRRIAAYLDRETARIDSLVREKEELLRLLEEKRASTISHAVTRGLNPKAKLKPSHIPWLGDVPEHWAIAQTRHLIRHLTSGSRGWSRYYSPNGDKFIRIGNLRRGSLMMDLGDIQHVQIPPDGTGETAERARIRKDDVLFSITAYLGSIGICPPEIEGAYVSQHVALVRVKQEKILPAWLGYFALGQSGQVQLNEASYGGTKLQLSLDDIRNFTVPCPPLDEQEAIVRCLSRVTTIFDSLDTDIKTSIALLREKRSSVISAAVTGEMNTPP